ncbi:unnamed protein product [Rhizopus stolonifer]
MAPKDDMEVDPLESLKQEYYQGKHLAEPVKEIQIIKANEKVTSNVNPHFYLKYTGIRVGMPERTDDDVANRSYTPHECRLRDLTYSANIFVDVEYTRGRQIVKRRM